MTTRILILIILVGASALLLSDAIFTVQEPQRALLLRFGALQKSDLQPGLHFKLPIAEEAKKFDGRVLTLDASPERFLTLEKKPLVVDSFVKWRIEDVGKYYTASGGDERRAEGRLAERVRNGLRNQISRRDMHEVVTGERDRLMDELTNELNREMLAEFGVRVVDVRVKRIDLPPEVSNTVYDRMASERQVLARQYRAQGQEQALVIRADADRTVTVIAAEAYRDAEILRGEGDARATETYARTFSQDSEFFSFYRSLNAYRNTFKDPKDLILLNAQGEFFKYLKAPYQDQSPSSDKSTVAAAKPKYDPIHEDVQR